MATTRTFDSLGIWALNANTVIPPNPVTGDAYRNTTTTQITNEEGEPFDTVPDSAVFNQKLFIVSSFTDEINKRGIVGWADVVDYTVPAIVFASDGLFYFCLAASGPSTTVKDPAGQANPGFWEIWVNGQIPIDNLDQFKLELADQTASTEGTRLVGHTGQTAFAAIDARTTIASLAATTGATLVNTATAGMSVQTFSPHAIVRTNADGTAILGTSFGVASVVAGPTGQYIINLNTALSNANFFSSLTVHTEAATPISGAIDSLTGGGTQVTVNTSLTTGVSPLTYPTGTNAGIVLILWDNP